MQKKPLSDSSVNSQVLLLFSNIIRSKYEHGLPCDLLLAETQPHSLGLYHFRKNTVSTEFKGICQKSVETFSLQKKFSPRKLDKKADILRCEHLETIIHFRKNMMA